MKKTMLSIGVVLVLSTFLISVSDAARVQYALVGFGKDYKRNFVGGKLEDVFNGVRGGIAPWLKSKVVYDKKKGRVLKLTYDVSKGEAQYSITVKNQSPFRQYNALMFYVKGSAIGILKVRVKSTNIHEAIVENVTDEWKKVVIGYKEFTKEKLFSPMNVSEVSFVIQSDLVNEAQGSIYLDEIALTNKRDKRRDEDDYPRPSMLMTINGKPVMSRPYEANILTCTAKYTYASAGEGFVGLRFEASLNQKDWFYVGEDTEKSDLLFSCMWDARYFEGGTYFVRAVALYKDGGRGEGREKKIRIENDIHFDEFLDQVTRKGFQYFIHERDGSTGLIKKTSEGNAPLDTTACGFALSVYCVGAERGYLPRLEAAHAVLNILDTFTERMESVHGFYPHDVLLRRGERKPTGDVIATTYLAFGALSVYEYFDDRHDLVERAIHKKALSLFRKIEWRRVIREKDNLLARTITRRGQQEGSIEGFGDGMLSYIVASAAPHASFSTEVWNAWAARYSTLRYGPYTVIAYPSLFAHQFPHIWLDLRGMRDAYANYVQNTRDVTFINREFSFKENNYEGEIWGLTACIGPHGWYEYGAPPERTRFLNDGTIAPSAAGGSITVTPILSKAALYEMYQTYGDKVWGKYGFIESFNPRDNYFAEVYAAVNVGNLILQIENYRSGLIWKLCMQSPYIKQALRKIGFEKVR